MLPGQSRTTGLTTEVLRGWLDRKGTRDCVTVPGMAEMNFSSAMSLPSPIGQLSSAQPTARHDDSPRLRAYPCASPVHGQGVGAVSGAAALGSLHLGYAESSVAVADRQSPDDLHPLILFFGETENAPFQRRVRRLIQVMDETNARLFKVCVKQSEYRLHLDQKVAADRLHLFTGWGRSGNELEGAESLGALDVTAESVLCERSRQPASLRTEGIRESQLPCIHRSDKRSGGSGNHGCHFQLNMIRLRHVVLRTPLSRVLHCYYSRVHCHDPER